MSPGICEVASYKVFCSMGDYSDYLAQSCSLRQSRLTEKLVMAGVRRCSEISEHQDRGRVVSRE